MTRSRSLAWPRRLLLGCGAERLASGRRARWVEVQGQRLLPPVRLVQLQAGSEQVLDRNEPGPVDGKPIASKPKTDEGRRTIPLDPLLVAILRSHQTRQKAEHLKVGPVYDGRGFVVADELGRPFHPDNLSKEFR